MPIIAAHLCVSGATRGRLQHTQRRAELPPRSRARETSRVFFPPLFFRKIAAPQFAHPAAPFPPASHELTPQAQKDRDPPKVRECFSSLSRAPRCVWCGCGAFCSILCRGRFPRPISRVLVLLLLSLSDPPSALFSNDGPRFQKGRRVPIRVCVMLKITPATVERTASPRSSLVRSVRRFEKAWRVSVAPRLHLHALSHRVTFGRVSSRPASVLSRNPRQTTHEAGFL